MIKILTTSLLLLFISCLTNKRANKTEEAQVGNNYYFENRCNCFKMGIRLGEVPIELKKLEGINEFKVIDKETTEGLSNAVIYAVVEDEMELKILNKLTISDINGQFPTNSESFVVYSLCYAPYYYKK